MFKVQHQITVIPRYVREFIEELWIFQFRLEARVIRQPKRLMEHPRFKAAYDFLLLRADAKESGEVIEKAQYWEAQFRDYEQTLLAQERAAVREERREGKRAVAEEVKHHQSGNNESSEPKKRRRRPRRRSRSKES